jgi:UDP-N-acetylglucosamine 1-carboxyvinyltransferase
VKNGAVAQFPLLDRTFAKFGVEVEHGADGFSRARVAHGLKVRPTLTANLMQKVEAAPWPYVPADLLPIFVALGARAEGRTLFWNKVYEGALGWSRELAKFGIDATLCDPHRLVVRGGARLVPATVESPYIIRVAIALFMVAASIDGRSTIRNALPIRRAHPRFVDNLNALGAAVEWDLEPAPVEAGGPARYNGEPCPAPTPGSSRRPTSCRTGPSSCRPTSPIRNEASASATPSSSPVAVSPG